MLHESVLIKRSQKKEKGNVLKEQFYFEEIENITDFSGFLVNLSKVNQDKIILVLSGINKGYETYKGGGDFEKSYSKIMSLLKGESEYFEEIKTNYLIVFSKDNLVKHESELYELSLIFYFSSLIGLRNNFTLQDVRKVYGKISLHGIFSFKRWRQIADWLSFFDGEHFEGEFSSLVPSD